MNGKLVIFSAPSGAGKTTIVRRLLDRGLKLEFSISATSREPRNGETDGVDYFFLTAPEFRKRIENGDFIEWEEVYHDHYYGTLRSEIERIWKAGKNVVFDVDVAGGISLKKIFGERSISFFVMPPSIEELESRLRRRGTDKEEKIIMRLEKAEREIAMAGDFDHIIINDDLDSACNKVEHLLRSFITNNQDR